MSSIQQVFIVRKSIKKSFFKSLPVLNDDKKHYTPLFILEEDEVDEKLLRNFIRNMTIAIAWHLKTVKWKRSTR